VERARRLDVLQWAENGFDPIPFGVEAARAYGQVAAAVIDFAGLGHLLTVVPVTRPSVAPA
jgi:hypothetical protein